MQTIMIFGRFGIFASMTSSSYDFWEIISLQLLANFIDYLCVLAQKMGSWGFPDRSGYPKFTKKGKCPPPRPARREVPRFPIADHRLWPRIDSHRCTEETGSSENGSGSGSPGLPRGSS